MLAIVLAQKIIDIVEQVMESQGACKALVIHIKVDKTTLISPDALQACFHMLTEDTQFADTALDINFMPLIYHCSYCNQVFPSEEEMINCIFCEWEDPTLVCKGSVYIKGIEVLNDAASLN